MTAKGPSARSDKFGAFSGVFTPSVLTILGVIMYQRVGWLVGQTGLLGALGIILLAHVVSITTGLSVASIATTRTVRTGGPYHIISRSLGLPIGGAIGLALFVAMSLAVSLYLIGFAENFVEVIGLENTTTHRQLVATGAAVTLTLLGVISTSLAMRVQFIVLVAIGASLVALFTGGGEDVSVVPLWPSGDSVSLETAFAVFFPAVTGFTAGVAMAGDLRDPDRDIPVGTMAATVIGLVVYVAVAIFLIAHVGTETLREDMNVWLRVASVPSAVTAGLWGATLSSALASLLGAPRVLKALADDRVVPAGLGRTHGKASEPRVAMLVCFLIAEAGILAGDLDTVAPVISMCFLSCYGFIGLACGLERWAGSPSFRPRFRVPAWVSLVGAGACFAIMFKLQMLAMIVAMAVMGGIYLGLKRRQVRLTSGDTWGGVWSEVVRRGLVYLHARRQDPRNWRPNVLVFAGAPSRRSHLVRLGEWIVRDSGLLTNYLLVQGTVEADEDRARSQYYDVRRMLGREAPDVLSHYMVCPDTYDGIRLVAQAAGLPGMRPNTVLLGLTLSPGDPARYVELLRQLVLLDRNLLLLSHHEMRGFGRQRRIDVWWGGREHNWSLMVLLATLLQSSEEWDGAEVRLNVVVPKVEDEESSQERLNKVLSHARLTAETYVYRLEAPAQHPFDVIRRESREADLTLLGLRSPDPGEAEAYLERIGEMLEGLGSTLLVRASSRFEGTGVLFDQERTSLLSTPQQ